MFGDSLDKIMKERKITSKALSKTLQDRFGYKIGKESIAKYRNNDRSPNPVLIGYIANILNVSTDFLLGVDSKVVPTVPVIGLASCGEIPSKFLHIDKKTVNYNGDGFNKDMYCVIANGNAMSPEIENMDEIICNPAEEPVSGDLVHYKIGGESAVKVLWIDEDADLVQLIPYKQSDYFRTTTYRKEDKDFNDLSMTKVVGINKITFDNQQSRLALIDRL